MILALLLIFAATVAAHVSLVKPIQDQLPLIARTNTPYSWTLAPGTFASLDGSLLSYTASRLPAWLSFDGSVTAFRGTPGPADSGSYDITVTAHAGTYSASSQFSLIVSSNPAPTLQKPLESQLYAGNPSLSSVFVLGPDSALKASNPAVRIPPRWSFSIGFDWDTFNSSKKVFYDALQADGSPLPVWLRFSPSSITFNGITPASQETQIVSLALHATDIEGYTSAALPLDMVVTAHELSMSTRSLPTINVTASSSFNVSLTSSNDLMGVLLDGKPLQPSDIVELSIDTAQYGAWLSYDDKTRTLSGVPPEDINNPGPVLPVVINADNQTLHTNVSLAVVPSFFSADVLSPIVAAAGRPIDYELASDYANKTNSGIVGQDVTLAASYDPQEAAGYLVFDSASGHLGGLIPDEKISYPRIIVTFTAYSNVTHSTSHAALNISLPRTMENHPQKPSATNGHHRNVTLSLAIAGAILGGMVLFALMLAAYRRYARPEDSGLNGDEAQGGHKHGDRWHGLETGTQSPGAWPEKAFLESERPASTSRQSTDMYATLSRGLRGVVSRISSTSRSDRVLLGSTEGNARTAKSEFFSKLRSTVGRVAGGSKPYDHRPIIGRPILVATSQDSCHTPTTPAINIFEDPSCVVDGSSLGASSPTISTTGALSIPRRRADFAGPSPAIPKVGRADGNHIRTLSGSSATSSMNTVSSSTSHAAEAVVHTVSRSRAMSVMSGKSGTGLSYLSLPDGTPAIGRPRLVPFTSSSQVPVPRLPSSLAYGRPSEEIQRDSMSSHHSAQGMDYRVSGGRDDLSFGLHYVQSLGEEVDDKSNTTASTSAVFYTEPLGSAVSRNPRSSAGSFSLAPSFYTQRGIRASSIPRMLVRVGERFNFRIPISAGLSRGSLVATLMDGRALPSCVHVDYGQGTSLKQTETIQISGIPAAGDIGDLEMGVFDSDGECVARAIIDVVPRS